MPLNLVGAIRSKMLKLLWQARVKEAVETVHAGARWKKNPRWLSQMYGKEVAWVWGHVGALRQKINSPQVYPLFG